jgi:alpha-tubulin suppressor-like RCC1 family protein
MRAIIALSLAASLVSGCLFATSANDAECRTPASTSKLVREIAAASSEVCALYTDGTVSCMRARYAAAPTRVNITAPTTFDHIAAGASFACGWRDDGQAFCWGNSDSGRLGRGVIDGSSPVIVDTAAPVLGLARVRGMGLGGTHACAFEEGGATSCWGSNFWAQLGTGDTADRYAPATNLHVASSTSLALTSQDSCALQSNGDVRCWGRAIAANVGRGFYVEDSGPAAVVLKRARQLSAGSERACALDMDGAVWCWDLNPAANAGNDSTRRPTRVQGIPRMRSMDVGDWRTACGVTELGAVWCWGFQSTASDPTPRPVDGLTDVTQLALGDYYACALRTDGKVLCWQNDPVGSSLYPAACTGSSSAPTPRDAGF